METGPEPREGERDARESAASRRNRVALLWITIACLALAAAGYAFTRWMMTQPPPPH